jgi:thiol-disulfide isomerase/thioredoxin
MLSCEQGLYECPKEESKSRLLHYVRKDVVFMIFCVLFSGFLVSPAFGQEAQGLNRIVPLKVGDVVPDELWDLRLKVVNHPDGREYIKLRDYRDKKLIILDFWGTWCGSCIAALPSIKNVQKEFAKDMITISLTDEKEDKIVAFATNNEVARSVQLWSVVEDSVLTKWITKYTYPHFTWIANGRILSHSSESALDVHYIYDYLAEGKVRWVEKVNLDKKGVFLSSLGDLSTANSSFYYEGYLDGAGGALGALPFHGGRTNYYFINFSQRAIYEWFLKRVAQSKGGTVSDIRYSPEFMQSMEWKLFNEKPISLQIIADKERPLQDVFCQYQIMSNWKLETDANGFYAKQVDREECGI